MRQHKYRAWDKKEKKWIHLLDLPNSWHGNNLALVCQFPENFEVVEFTGLKDAKGVEIYEGDIVHYSWHDAEFQEGEDWKGVVEFKGGAFWLQDSLNNYDTEYIEVIGNKFENKELLK